MVRENTTLKLWYNLTVLRQAAFTGCIRCELVCPVGEDYPEIEKSRVRQQDLPGGVRRSVNDGFVRIENVTCPES